MQQEPFYSLRRRRRRRKVDWLPVTPALAWALFRRRRQLGLSRERLAELAEERLAQRGVQEKVSYDYIRRLEWGEVDASSRRRVEAIAEVLGLDLEKDLAEEEGLGFPGPTYRHSRDPFAERVRILRDVENWLRTCSDREVALLRESWPTLSALMSRLAPLVSQEEGAREALTPEHVFEQNKGSLWKTPSDIYQWLERLLVLIEEAVPWRREVKAIREAVMAAMRWEVERRLREGEQEGEEGAEENGGES